MNRNITAAILIVLAIGIYFTVTKGVLTDAQAIKAVNDQYASSLTSAEQLIKVRDKVQSDWKNISADDQARLDKMIPNSVDNIRLIIDLNNIAMQHGFSLRNIKATASAAPAASNASQVGKTSPNSSSPIATPTLDIVKISFSVTAPYLQFISLMQDLEANLRIMDLTHLSVTANDSGTYDFGVDLQTYWLRQ